jgi:hypothetical protein
MLALTLQSIQPAMRAAQAGFADMTVAFRTCSIHVPGGEAMDRKDFAMNDRENSPSMDRAMISHYEAEARRLRAEVLRGIAQGGWSYLCGLFTVGAHGAAQPSK